MRLLRKLFIAFAAAIVAMASGVLVAHADSAPTVYDTPGGHISAGRLWDTTCEKYSSNVVRCRTNIWATQVQYVKGRYEKKTGWTFNNLSYLASPRVSWAGNNLARTNNKWVSGGKTWRTECDTAVTGKGGCRSYVWTKQVQAKKTGSIWTYVNAEGWVFNNLVLFSGAKVPHVSKVPNWVVDCPGQYIEPKGLKCSPVRLHARGVDLFRLGYVGQTRDGGAFFPYVSQSLENRGVWIEFGNEDVYSVSLETGFIPTKDGASVGMTVGQVKAIYGARFAVVPKENYGVKQYFGTVREGAYELQFRVNGKLAGEEDGEKYYEYAPTRPLADGDIVAEISAQRYTDDVSWEGVPQPDWSRGK